MKGDEGVELLEEGTDLSLFFNFGWHGQLSFEEITWSNV